MNKCIKSLKKESSAEIDGLTAEHILFAKDSNLSAHLCYLFSICFQHGVVPEDFRSGIMVPILKKPTLDPSIPKNYRPIIISTEFSKLVEKYILHETNETEFDESQFGFICGRGTNMAVSLAHDMAAYCNSRGSSVSGP